MKPAEVARLAELATGRTVLEVGSWLGASTVAMARTALMVHSIDWHRGDPHAGDDETMHPFLDNLAASGFRDKVVAHIGRSEDVLPILREGVFDFAFHDAYHTAEAVTADVGRIVPLLKPGSLLAFHDYGLFGVQEAVDRLTFGKLVELTETLAVVRVP